MILLLEGSSNSLTAKRIGIIDRLFCTLLYDYVVALGYRNVVVKGLLRLIGCDAARVIITYYADAAPGVDY